MTTTVVWGGEGNVLINRRHKRNGGSSVCSKSFIGSRPQTMVIKLQALFLGFRLALHSVGLKADASKLPYALYIFPSPV
jgi:hypothetical protein